MLLKTNIEFPELTKELCQCIDMDCITAVLEGLKMLKFPCIVKLYSDSAYVVNCFNQGWIYNWMKKGWKTANNEPVKNKEL